MGLFSKKKKKSVPPKTSAKNPDVTNHADGEEVVNKVGIYMRGFFKFRES